MVRRWTIAASVVTLLAAAGCGDRTRPVAGRDPDPVAATSATAVGRPGSGPPAATLPSPTAAFEVRGRKVVSGPRAVEVRLGTSVVLEVLIDAADEVHVHGYEEKIDIVPGARARIEFAATIPGVFEVELHSGVKLCDLRVR